MKREFTCIICPNGCHIEAVWEKEKVLSIRGALCSRGREYVEQELTCAKRNIASSVLVKGGELPLVSVRLTAPIPKERIFDVMEEIRRIQVRAPVRIHQVLVPNIRNLHSDLIATRNVERAE